MPLVALKSGTITARDSGLLVNANRIGGEVQSAVGTLEAQVNDSIGSTYRMFQIPSNARVNQILLYCDDQGTTGTADVGLYRTTQDGSAGVVVDADFFASAVDVNTAALNGLDVTHESGVFNIDDAEKQIWEGLGLSADPGIFYDVVLTLVAASTAGGTITLKGTWVV